MATFTNSRQTNEMPTAPPRVYQPGPSERASTNGTSASKSRESVTSADTMEEEREKMLPLAPTETLSSLHFLLAHQPSRPHKPGRIVERKRAHAVPLSRRA
jgi:hypothetical protein